MARLFFRRFRVVAAKSTAYVVMHRGSGGKRPDRRCGTIGQEVTRDRFAAVLALTPLNRKPGCGRSYPA